MGIHIMPSQKKISWMGTFFPCLQPRMRNETSRNDQKTARKLILQNRKIPMIIMKTSESNYRITSTYTNWTTVANADGTTAYSIGTMCSRLGMMCVEVDPRGGYCTFVFKGRKYFKHWHEPNLTRKMVSIRAGKYFRKIVSSH